MSGPPDLEPLRDDIPLEERLKEYKLGLAKVQQLPRTMTNVCDEEIYKALIMHIESLLVGAKNKEIK